MDVLYLYMTTIQAMWSGKPWITDSNKLAYSTFLQADGFTFVQIL